MPRLLQQTRKARSSFEISLEKRRNFQALPYFLTGTSYAGTMQDGWAKTFVAPCGMSAMVFGSLFLALSSFMGWPPPRSKPPSLESKRP